MVDAIINVKTNNAVFFILSVLINVRGKDIKYFFDGSFFFIKIAD